jgi:hypothetical protein
MKKWLPSIRKKRVFWLFMVPFVFWSLSKALPLAVSGINWVAYRYLSCSDGGERGFLTVISGAVQPIKTIDNIKLPLSRKSDQRFDHEQFHLQMVGLIKVEKSGTFWMGTKSDDGSWIWLDGKKIVNNGGLHAREEMKNFVFLKEGLHTFELKFENILGDAYLDLFWILPNGSRQPLPFRSHPLGRIIPFLFGISQIFYKIAQYWFFFLVPLLFYKILFPPIGNQQEGKN